MMRAKTREYLSRSSGSLMSLKQVSGKKGAPGGTAKKSSALSAVITAQLGRSVSSRLTVSMISTGWSSGSRVADTGGSGGLPSLSARSTAKFNTTPPRNLENVQLSEALADEMPTRMGEVAR